MLIDVGFAEWEQACCGMTCEVGASAALTIFRTAHSEQGRSAGPEFSATWHDLPLRNAYAEVVGEVVGIRAVVCTSKPYPGHPGVMTDDLTTRREVEIDTLSRQGEVDLEEGWHVYEFIVTLDIPESSDLSALTV